MPKFYGGFQNSLDYKGFQLDILFQFVKQLGGNVIFYNNGSTIVPGVFNSGISNQPITVLNAWQKPGGHSYCGLKYSSINGVHPEILVPMCKQVMHTIAMPPISD